jgi:hypothetical protein
MSDIVDFKDIVCNGVYNAHHIPGEPKEDNVEVVEYYYLPSEGYHQFRVLRQRSKTYTRRAGSPNWVLLWDSANDYRQFNVFTEEQERRIKEMIREARD